MLREQLPYVTVLSVIDWLGDHCVYTLTPKTSSTMSPVDAFLTKTNEGYCVQFATSAALILRELGFPVRYVEGYLASDYQRDADPDRINRYITTVRDYDAHAWIEVYFDGVGWMQSRPPRPTTTICTSLSPSEYHGSRLTAMIRCARRRFRRTTIPRQPPKSRTTGLC